MIKKRLLELAEKAYQQNIYTNSNFLNPLEISQFLEVAREIQGIPYTLYGGYEESERRVVRFGSSDLFGYEAAFPIQCIHIKPAAAKFADELSHRDFLGALINLGIERDMLGDILIKNNEGFLYCMEGMAQFIAENLTKIKHTNVRCVILKELPPEIEQRLESVRITCSSERADTVIAKVYAISRQKSLSLFQEKKVFICAALTENNSMLLKAGDVVSVRGYGKFRFEKIGGNTKKGKIFVEILKYC